MNPLITFIIIGAAASVVWYAGDNAASLGKAKLASALRVLGLTVAVVAVHAFHIADKKQGAGRLSAAMVVLEDRIKEGDVQSALQIADQSIRIFGGEPSQFSRAADRLWTFAIHTSERARMRSELKTTDLTTRPGQEPR